MADEFNERIIEADDDQQIQHPIDEEGVDPVSDFIEVLNYLENAISNARSPMLNSRAKILDEDMLLDIIKDLKNNIPVALQYAIQMVNESNRITTQAEQRVRNMIATANERADAIVNDAESRAQATIDDAERRASDTLNDAEIKARAMIDQSAIKQQALAEAHTITVEANSKVVDLRDTAYDYCEHMLNESEKALRDAFEDIRRNKQQLLIERENQRQKALMG